MIATLQEVLDVPVPKATRSYQPLSNEDLIVNLKKVVEHYGMSVSSESYELGAKGQQLFGTFTVEGNNEMRKCIGFRNSYNKTLPLGFAAGSHVIVCSNLMFVGDIIRMRKHTTYMYEDFQRLAVSVVEALDKNFNKITTDVDKLKEVTVDQKLVSELAAEMFMTEELISITQLSVFKQEWDKKKIANDGNPQTGWDVMNHLTESLKKIHPTDRMEKQINTHDYLMNKLELV